MNVTVTKFENRILAPASAPLRFFGWFWKNTMSQETNYMAVNDPNAAYWKMVKEKCKPLSKNTELDKHAIE